MDLSTWAWFVVCRNSWKWEFVVGVGVGVGVFDVGVGGFAVVVRQSQQVAQIRRGHIGVLFTQDGYAAQAGTGGFGGGRKVRGNGRRWHWYSTQGKAYACGKTLAGAARATKTEDLDKAPS